MKQQAVILGDGTMATALAKTIAQNGYRTVLWSPDQEVVDSINLRKANTKHFTSYILPNQLTATGDIEEALSGAALAIVAVKSEKVRTVAASVAPFLIEDTVVISATKGIEVATQSFMSRIIADEMKTENIGIISGPNITIDIMNSSPTAILVAARNQFAVDVARSYLESKFLKVFGSTDIVGIEMLSVLKNIVAIAAGLAINLGDNARSYVIALGLAEIQALARALGSRPESSGGLADIGEVFLSSTSKYSRNHMIGIDVANGAYLPELLTALEAINETAEGVNAVAACGDLAKAAGIEMPLAECVYQILFKNLPATETLRAFLSEKRAAKWLSAPAA